MSYADDKVKQRLLFSNQGDITLRLMIKSVQVSNSSEIVSRVHLICKFQEDPIQTEQVMLITKSKLCFFSD